MTTITIQRDADTYRLTAVGHATGEPAVCAAVSGLVYALGGYLTNLARAGEVTLERCMLESGAAELEASGDAARQSFELAAVGLLQVARSYPKQVKIIFQNFQSFFQIPGGDFDTT